MKDKLSAELSAYNGKSTGTSRKAAAPVLISGNLAEATEALMVLGYSRNEALSALKSIDTSALELDEIIRLALKKLIR